MGFRRLLQLFLARAIVVSYCCILYRAHFTFENLTEFLEILSY